MKKTWSRKKINDEFTGLKKADGTPMSRQQVHMMRKKAKGLCLTCGEPAIGVYCLKHTVAARERMRQKLKYRRRLRKSPSYIIEQQVRSKRRLSRARNAAKAAEAASPSPKTAPRSKSKSAKK
jgi:hypothetical protein